MGIPVTTSRRGSKTGFTSAISVTQYYKYTMELYTVNIILGKANMANVLSALQVSLIKDYIIIVITIFVQLPFHMHYKTVI